MNHCVDCEAVLTGKRTKYCSYCWNERKSKSESRKKIKKAERKVYNRKCYLKNREAVNKRARQWALDNPEKAKAATKKYRKSVKYLKYINSKYKGVKKKKLNYEI